MPITSADHSTQPPGTLFVFNGEKTYEVSSGERELVLWKFEEQYKAGTLFTSVF